MRFNILTMITIAGAVAISTGAQATSILQVDCASSLTSANFTLTALADAALTSAATLNVDGAAVSGATVSGDSISGSVSSSCYDSVVTIVDGITTYAVPVPVEE